MTTHEGEVSGNGRDQMAELLALAAERDVPLHPDLVPWVEESGPFGGPMLRHPLVYDMFVSTMPGMTNKVYAQKKAALAEAVAEEDWHTAVFLHERAYRFKAMVDYVTGRDLTGEVLPLGSWHGQDTLDLVADVWVDSENIGQNIEDWRALLCNGDNALWLGTPAEREQFEDLETHPNDTLGPCIKAWRGGSVGDWSWTTDLKTAQFFSRRSGLPVRGAMIPVADVFGYLTRRSEAELLVKFTDFRASLVYPEQYPRTTGW